MEETLNILSDEQRLRYCLLKENNFDVDKAKKAYDFINGFIIKPSDKQIDESVLTTDEYEYKEGDGVYLIFGNDDFAIPLTYSLITWFSDKPRCIGCTGIGVKFNGHSFMINKKQFYQDTVALLDSTNKLTKEKNIEVTPSYNIVQALTDYDGKGNTEKIKYIINECVNISHKEWIPSLGELSIINYFKEYIDAGLELSGGKEIKNALYWSSTLYNKKSLWAYDFEYSKTKRNVRHPYTLFLLLLSDFPNIPIFPRYNLFIVD